MKRLLAVTCLMTASLAFAQSSTVYKTLDQHGAVSFSDTPPGGDEAVETLVVDSPAAQSDGVYEENLEAMRETTDRLAEDRMAREKHRAEMRELAARADAYSEPQTVEYDIYNPVYTGGYYRRHHYRPIYRPGHPEHPIVRPPLRPRPSQVQPQRPTHHNSQLMRPITTR
ncbi:hypothetical protein A3709_12135 [Halioglobus sp. HI00S01]|uniref:DUF4124 domain-containing protein n=1 Tax=Halioglobus sp. HI00S01 TaxID=1822214 RepID=UPI0007C2CCE7|nr:DUF4124 domain-containing protein [Halioglobus sp. HI00S01]KZX60332.1 hypothetical protein A3709_12135 [Halioglobus sp. HI00S01]